MISVFAFYRFTAIADPAAMRQSLLQSAGEHNLRGTLLLAEEGVNGTLAGDRSQIEIFLDRMADTLEIHRITGRWSYAETPPFRKFRIKLRKEIVTLGRPDLNPARQTGNHVGPDEWNRLLARDDVVLIDTRNTYEIEIGTFPGALNPATKNFREFPEFVARHKDEWRDKPVAMFCTGGIRCEKASALLIEEGVNQVYQLEGGILAYLEAQDDEDSLWDGECFVFDARVAVDETLEPGHHVQCHACRRPVAPEDLAHEHYEEGLSCPACFGSISEEKRAALRMRRKQSQLRRTRAAEA